MQYIAIIALAALSLALGLIALVLALMRRNLLNRVRYLTECLNATVARPATPEDAIVRQRSLADREATPDKADLAERRRAWGAKKDAELEAELAVRDLIDDLDDEWEETHGC